MTRGNENLGNAGDAPAPPLAALRLADALIDERIREAVIGDLIERFHAERVPTLGVARARLWFWRQTILAVAHFPPRLRRSQSTGDGFVTGFLADIASASRTLRRAPAFTVLCAATLGLGIGSATAIFSVADPIILRPLPYASPERLFSAWETDERGRPDNFGFATYADVAASAKSFEHSAAVGSWQPVLTRDGVAEQLNGLRVSWGYFRTLGVRPALGKDFEPEDDSQARSGVVIVSNALWRTRFRGDTSVIGSFTDIGGRQMRIGGVMPADYDDILAPGAQIWRVLGYDATLPFACRSCRHLRVVARTRPGVTPSAAVAELNVISARLVREHPRDYPAPGMQIVQAQREATKDIRPALNALLVAVLLLLLIATVNVAGLQLARAVQRDEEFAIRAALGAGGGRLTRQLLAEGLVLAVVAGAIAWMVARVGLSQLVGRLPQTMPRLAAVHLDVRAFAVATLVTLSAGIAIGLAPAWHARRRALVLSLRGGRRVGGTPHRVRSTFVVTEVALAVMLLAGAGLLARSLTRLLSVDPGVDIARVATAQIQVSGPRYADSAATFAWQDQVVSAARAIPGVTSAAIGNQLPLGGSFDAYGVQAEDKPLANPELAPNADRYTVTTDYLRTMGIKVLAGRDLEAGDNGLAAAPVAIVSQALARRIWGTESPLGKRVHLGEPIRPWYTVVGVAGDVHHRGLDVETTTQIYLPTRRWFFQDNTVDVVVRTAGDPASALSALRRAVVQPDAGTVVTRLSTMADVRAKSTAQRALALTLFSVFAAISLLLAAAGIFGALAGAVAERRREIGLRTALGATPAAIIRLVLGQGLGLAGAGALIGLTGSFVGSRAIEDLLFGVGTHDAPTIVAVSAAVGLAAVLASAIPAWRALRVDPITALRAD